MRGEEDVGLGGMVVMRGVEITPDAGMCVLSWSMLGLDGSSEDTNQGPEVERKEANFPRKSEIRTRITGL